MRRPLCVILLLFLSVYLAVSLGLAKKGSGQASNAGQGMADAWSGRELQLTGRVASPYQPADGSQENMSFTLQNITSLSDTEGDLLGEYPQSGNDSEISIKNHSVICKLKSGEAMPRVGSAVKVRGVAAPFLEATNPGEFDVRAYYEAQGVLFSLNNAEILAQSEAFDRIGNFLYELGSRTASFYRETLGEEDGAVASAMVLGIKKDLDAQLKALYQDAGIAHVLAISGLHITFIGMALFRLLKKVRIPLLPAAAISSAVLLCYGKMVGMGVSTKRAILMFFLALAAQLLKRTPDTLTSLAVAACAILLQNPQELLNSGFQLSFLAVAGAATAVPVFQEKGIKAPDREESKGKRLLKWADKGLTASFGITLFMLPALLFHFYKWNPWSVFANLLVIPLMGALLVWLLALAAACWIFSGLSGALFFLRLLALPARGVFWLYRRVCEGILLLPGSGLHTGAPRMWQLFVFAAGMAALLLCGRKIPPKPRMACAVLLSMIFMLRLPGKLTITMLDVGQGECVCVETKQHHFYLLDAGSSSKRNTGQYQIIPFLEYNGARCLEGIFVSHWDADHISALEEIFEWAKSDRVKIKKLILPDTALSDDALGELLSMAESYGIGTERIRAGQSMKDHEMELICLHPYEGEAATDRNQISAVLKLTCGDFSALFTGDLEEAGERWLVENYGESVLDCELLDAGHHGSSNASTDIFLEAASPQAVLISCGRNNSYGHPAKETLARIEAAGAACYVTAQRGAVRVTVGKNGMKISPFLAW